MMLFLITTETNSGANPMIKTDLRVVTKGHPSTVASPMPKVIVQLMARSAKNVEKTTTLKQCVKW